MKIAYFNCFSGISGDMCLGAIVDAGISVEILKKELKKISIKGYEISAKKVKRAGLSSTKVYITLSTKHKEQRAKTWKGIEKIIQASSFSQEIKQKGLKIFKRLFEAEAKVHGETFNTVHLHELGAVDCIIDVFGTVIGLYMLGVKEVYSSPVNLGGGSVKTRHGILPVPAPATTEILKGLPVYSSGTSHELTTPTGSAIVKELSSGFGDIPLMNIEKIGIGAGSRDFKDRPNVLRLFVGDFSLPPSIPLWQRGIEGDTKKRIGKIPDSMATVIEANIDDMNPQIYEYAMEELFKGGALDVYLTQVLMKKGRPGIKLSVICDEMKRGELIKIILKETTTIGLRFYEVKRRVLHREIRLLETEFGSVRMKFSKLGDEILKVTPEYEDCKRIAKKNNIPLIEMIEKIKLGLRSQNIK